MPGFLNTKKNPRNPRNPRLNYSAHGHFDLPFRNPEMPWRDGDISQRIHAATHFKQWVGFGITHPEWHVTFFMVNAGYLTSAVVYAHSRNNQKSIKHARAWPGNHPELPADLYKGRARFTAPGFDLEFRAGLDAGRHEISVRATSLFQTSISGHIEFHQDTTSIRPLVASLPLSGGHMYTHKAPIPVSGALRIGNHRIRFDPARDIALLDEHRSLLPRPMRWRWATLAGRAPGGRILALNLGDHDTIADPQQWNENAIWLGDTLEYIGPVSFKYSPQVPCWPWTIQEQNNRVKLTFFPESQKTENVRIGPLGMKYYQLSGRFQGHAQTKTETFIIKDFQGVAENMDANF